MTHPLVSKLNAALRAAGLPHEAVYVEADDAASDSDIEFRLIGQPVRFSIQLAECGHTACLNEHGFDEDGAMWMRDHAMIPAHRTTAVCAAAIAALSP